MPELNFYLEIPVTRRMFRGLGVALLLPVLAGDLSSESVTLTTYYPAPSGAYSQLITTQNVLLSRDSQFPSGNASFVVVGSTSPGTAGQAPKAGTRLSVLGGPLGIGTFTPSALYGLQVFGAGDQNVDFKVNGRIMLSDYVNNAANLTIAGKAAVANSTVTIGQVPPGSNVPGNATTLGIFAGPTGTATSWRLTMNNTGGVGVGIDPGSPTKPLNPQVGFDFAGSLSYVDACVTSPPAPVNYIGGNFEIPCGLNTYLTYLPGLMSKYQTGGDSATPLGGKVYCCPCTAGVCPQL